MKKILFTIAFTILIPTFVFAEQSFDPRSVGMGGIGASTSHYITAPFHNPALVARYNEEDDFGILLPALGLSIHDGGMINASDDISDAFDAYTANTSPANTTDLINELKDLQGDIASAQGSGAIALAIPNKMVAANVFLKTSIDMVAYADITDADLNLAPGVAADLTSRASVMGVQITEFGVALAKEYKFETGTLYYGITPKLQQIDTYNHVFSINDIDFDMDSNDNKKSMTTVNFDAGLAYAYEGFTFGLVAKNIIPQEFDMKKVDGIDAKYALGPVITASASYSQDLFTVGVDVDVTKTERFKSMSGYNNKFDSNKDDIQMLGIGAEINAWDWVKFRAGYQVNMLNNIGNQFTFGIGLNPFDTVQIELAAGIGSDQGDAYAGSLALQLSMTF